ncbi:helix-turn-helix transcriptional regulator [Streptomyces sp. Tu 3180]|uniref:helix-turn-helix transcriptional regulator n=1 Tax=Streptomyces sp. Tu 3180 TaxID=2682611 RepID=UPI00135C9CD6|nr:helix-turn-helix transcriptional regulator [Streptomyces sp. Tu 3180]KAF3466062.1 helix-turn-helix transcriptional regulator [Streptomyces sp. Tu 3180]
MAQPDLQFLGVAPRDEELYRFLLRTGGAEPDELNGPAGHEDGSAGTARDTEAACRRLTGLGLAVESMNGVLRPVPPAKAVERLVELRVKQLQDELEETVGRTGIVDSLLAERESGAQRGAALAERGGAPIRHLEGLEEVRAAIDELTFFTRTESLTTYPRGTLSPQGIANSRAMDLRILRRGVRMRTLMGSGALDDPTTLAYLRELVAKGAEIRISHQPLERMIICDRAAALTPIDPAHTAKGAILTREPGLVAALVSLFERMWDTAQELPVGEDGTDAEDGLPTEIERKILKSLYTADKDESGARDLGISVRTYRKHVAVLMQRLDATNRFQAALLARERGWL